MAESTEYQLKTYLLLLATLVATVTYAAGLNLPGGSWLEDAPGGQLAGDSILRDTNYKRYICFYVFNATSFAASLVVCLLLLFLQKKDDQRVLLYLTRTVMVVDLLGLMGAYVAGGSHDSFTTICASVQVSFVVVYVAAVFALDRRRDGGGGSSSSEVSVKDQEILMFLVAIFAATIAFVAGLNPPGGFWRRTSSTQEGGGEGHSIYGHHTAGDPVLQAFHPRRYRAFFFCNTTAFVMSLLAIMRIVKGRSTPPRVNGVVRYGPVIIALLGLGGAYAAGSCRDTKHTIRIIGLVLPVLLCIFVQPLLAYIANRLPCGCRELCDEVIKKLMPDRDSIEDKDLAKTREYVQLLATLAATIAYQAGVDPPGGVWSESGKGYTVGDPILLTTHPVRYKVFFYFNSAAFVASLVIMVMLQSERLIRRHVLEAAMILDLFALIGAYAVGSCRDTSSSIYTAALAGVVLIYVVIHIAFCTLDHERSDEEDPNKKQEQEQQAKIKKHRLKKNREVLLLLAILAATLTYQAGLTPPGGFWEISDDKLGHHAGFPVLQDKYPRRYKAFFYCNAASFMASVALIVLLLNRNLYRPGIESYALFACMVAGMLGLMGAYGAGSSMHRQTSIIFFLLLLVAALTILVYLAIYLKPKNAPQDPPPGQEEEKDSSSSAKNAFMTYQYLMLVGILAATVTYLTGLKPPGGLWRDDGNGHSAGNPVLYDISKVRYNVFLYSNSISFMASIIIIALLLIRMFWPNKKPKEAGIPAAADTDVQGGWQKNWPMHTAMLLALLALLIAYAAGSARDRHTSRNFILLLPPILVFVVFVFLVTKGKNNRTPK